MLVVAQACFCQLNMKINDLNIPTSPAFVLMDKSPASIEKPSAPKALAVSLINVWEGNGAVEFTPYWFKDRPSYTFKSHLKNKTPVWQTFAVSAATAKTDTVTGIAAGFRTQVLKIYSRGMIKTLEDKEKQIIGLLSVDPDDLDLEAIEAAKNELHNLQTRTTWTIELAGAYMGASSPSKTLSSSKAGFWTHFRFSPEKMPLNFVALGRYSWAAGSMAKSGGDSAFFDYGINISYQNQEFDVQVEYVNRRDLSIKSNYDRLAFVANYEIIPGIVAVASLGKDFKKVNNVFALLGIKFGISKEITKLN